MRRYLILLNLVWFCVLTIGWLVDPYRIFHKPWLRENYYASDAQMRDAAVGIINTEVFDSLILGSSMAANFSASEASRVFGSQFVNISMDGSSITERSVVLEYALKTRPLDKVIFSFDWGSLDVPSVASTPLGPYAYLYDETKVNDLQIYLSSFKGVRHAFCPNTIFFSTRLCKSRKRNLEGLVEWHSNVDHLRRFGGLDNWLNATNNGQIQGALQSIYNSIRVIEAGQVPLVDFVGVGRVISDRKNVFEKSILRLAAEYPDTVVYLFMPPYSRLNYAMVKQSDPQSYESYLETLRFVVNESSQYPNIKVFGFETEDFLDDIANYKDTSHYHHRYNSKMLYWMKADEHQLTLSNLEDYIHEISQRAANYPLREIGEKISRYLAQ